MLARLNKKAECTGASDVDDFTMLNGGTIAAAKPCPLKLQRPIGASAIFSSLFGPFRLLNFHTILTIVQTKVEVDRSSLIRFCVPWPLQTRR